MKARSFLACVMSGLLSCGAIAQTVGQRPVAVVESVSGKVDGVEFMDYVSAGQVITLGPKDSVVLGYLKTCLRETITGGTVIVLEEQSLVQLGKVERSQVKCDSKHMHLNGRDANESAGNIFRSGPREAKAAAAPQVRLTLYGRSPIVEVNQRRERIVFQRLDKDEPRIEVAVSDSALIRGRFLDLAAAGTSLAAGGRYVANQGSASIEFTVDAQAGTGATPIIGRLLRLD